MQSYSIFLIDTGNASLFAVETQVPKDPHLEEVMRYRGSPLENLLGQVYGLWMQVATSEGHAPWMAMALTGHSRGALVWEALQGLAAQGDWVTVLSLLELVDGLDGGGQGQRLDLVAHRRNVLKLLAAHESTGDCPGRYYRWGGLLSRSEQRGLVQLFVDNLRRLL